ncbi:MAG: hypothetical protein ACRCZD_05760 [Phycicoccus sp.]
MTELITEDETAAPSVDDAVVMGDEAAWPSSAPAWPVTAIGCRSSAGTEVPR